MNMYRRNVVGLAAWVIVGALGIALPGCAPEVLPATQHAPVAPAAVTIYQKQPSKYEVLGTISVAVTPDMKWDERGDSTAGFEALKAKAAAMGANGLLLIGPPGTSDIFVTAGYKGSYYQVPLKADTKTAVGQAIFMINQ